MKTKELSKTQAELLSAMQNGAKCEYMPYMGSFNQNAYYYRNDTMKRCTAAARSLLERGLVKMVNKDWRGHTLIAAPMTEPIPPQ